LLCQKHILKLALLGCLNPIGIDATPLQFIKPTFLDALGSPINVAMGEPVEVRRIPFVRQVLEQYR
jgi:hypothetical protein